MRDRPVISWCPPSTGVSALTRTPSRGWARQCWPNTAAGRSALLRATFCSWARVRSNPCQYLNPQPLLLQLHSSRGEAQPLSVPQPTAYTAPHNNSNNLELSWEVTPIYLSQPCICLPLGSPVIFDIFQGFSYVPSSATPQVLSVPSALPLLLVL